MSAKTAIIDAFGGEYSSHIGPSFTINELCRATGYSESSVRTALKKLTDEGRLVRVENISSNRRLEGEGLFLFKKGPRWLISL